MEQESLGKCKTRHKLELKAWEKSKIALVKAAKKDKIKLQEIEVQEKTLLERHRDELKKYDDQSREEKEGKDEIPVDDKAELARAKAQKKRDKRAQKEEERWEKNDGSKFEEASQNSAGQVELRQIQRKLDARHLKIKDVAADGWCMFASISDQLRDVSPEQLRKQSVEFMRAHREEFEMFFEDFESHLDKIENTSEWGGQAELVALAKSCNVRIRVVTADADDVVIEEQNKKEIILCFHKLLYANGEHYNSVTEK